MHTKNICIINLWVYSCFLQRWSKIWGLLVPMTVILVVNLFIFALVVRQLFLTAKTKGRERTDNKSERRDKVERVQNAVCILILMGLTWLPGYLLNIRAISSVRTPTRYRIYVLKMLRK